MKILTTALALLFGSSAAMAASMGNSAPSDATTNTGISPSGATTPMSEQEYPNSGQTRNRSDVGDPTDLSVSETSSSTSTAEQMNTSPTEIPSSANESEKSNNTLSAGEVFPTGPYSNGEYKPAIGEEKQAEEARLESWGEESRVNQEESESP